MKTAKWMLLAALLVVGCKEEPTIVIKFEPNDLSGAAAKAVKVDAGAVMAAAPADAAAKAAPVEAPAVASACKAAADCVAVNEDCCGCSAGGKQVAMSVSASVAHGKSLKAKCKEIVCPTVMSDDPSCAQGPDCVAGKCVLGEIKAKGKGGKPKK